MKKTKNLENREILSDDILNAISIIVKNTPNAVFGGSIALNAVGLLNRPISDIDLFFELNESLSQNGYLKIEDMTEIASDTVTDTNGNDIQRTGAKIDGVKTCCFKVPVEMLSCSKYRFFRNGIEYCINIQNINYAIEAKRYYSDKSSKHRVDLYNIEEALEGLF